MKAPDQVPEIVHHETWSFAKTALAHAETCRLDSACYIGMVGLSGALLASSDWKIWQLAVATLIPALTSISAQYAGAYFDRDIDAVTKPDKPVPSGRISAGSALAGMVGSIAMAFALAALLNPVNLAFVPLALLLGGAYGRFLKPRRALRVFARGIATIAAFGVGTLTTAGMPLWDLIFLSLIFWQQDSMYHLVGAIGDTEADRRAGWMTFPVRFGHRAALWLFVVMLVCWLGSAALQPVSVQSRPFGQLGYLPFLGIAGVLAIVAAVMLFRGGRPVSEPVAWRVHDVLRFERLFLAAGAIAAAGAWLLSAVLLMFSTVTTMLARKAS